MKEILTNSSCIPYKDSAEVNSWSTDFVQIIEGNHDGQFISHIWKVNVTLQMNRKGTLKWNLVIMSSKVSITFGDRYDLFYTKLCTKMRVNSEILAHLPSKWHTEGINGQKYQMGCYHTHRQDIIHKSCKNEGPITTWSKILRVILFW